MRKQASEVERCMGIHAKRKEEKKKMKHLFIEIVLSVDLILLGIAATNAIINGVKDYQRHKLIDNPIFSNSDVELITISDAEGLSEEEVVLAMAEIYGRYGQHFKTGEAYKHCVYSIPKYAELYVANPDSMSLYDLNYIEATNIRVLESVYPGYQDPVLESIDLDDPYIVSILDTMYSLY